jgi:hypothetical protein
MLTWKISSIMNPYFMAWRNACRRPDLREGTASSWRCPRRAGHPFRFAAFFGAVESGVNAICDEVECCASLHGDRSAGVLGEHKDWSMVDRVVAPPSLPTVVRPGPADWAKHVAAHNPGADVFETSDHHIVIQTRRSSLRAVHLVVATGGELPSEERPSTPTGLERSWLGRRSKSGEPKDRVPNHLRFRMHGTFIACSKVACSSANTDRRGDRAPRWLRSSAIKAFHIRSPPSPTALREQKLKLLDFA